jgi:hypothetical protein
MFPLGTIDIITAATMDITPITKGVMDIIRMRIITRRVTATGITRGTTAITGATIPAGATMAGGTTASTGGTNTGTIIAGTNAFIIDDKGWRNRAGL